MEIPRHWRIRKERYSMVGGACPNCETKMFPVRSICPTCGHGAHSFGISSQETQLAQAVIIPNPIRIER